MLSGSILPFFSGFWAFYLHSFRADVQGHDVSVEEQLCIFTAGYSGCGDLQSHKQGAQVSDVCLNNE